MTDVTKQLADTLEAIGSVCPYYPGDDAHLRKAYALISSILDACRQQSCDLGPICLGCEPKEECKPTLTEKQIRDAANGIAIRVAENCGSVPNLTFPHIYLGLKELISTQGDK